MWQVETVKTAAVSEHGGRTVQLAELDLQGNRRASRRAAGLFLAFIMVSSLVHAVLLIVSVLSECPFACRICSAVVTQ